MSMQFNDHKNPLYHTSAVDEKHAPIKCELRKRSMIATMFIDLTLSKNSSRVHKLFHQMYSMVQAML
jgi:hypothetical protein